MTCWLICGYGGPYRCPERRSGGLYVAQRAWPAGGRTIGYGHVEDGRLSDDRPGLLEASQGTGDMQYVRI